MQGAASGHSRTYRSGGAAQSHSRTYRSTHCYEWTIGQWEQVPKPLVPKACTTLARKERKLPAQYAQPPLLPLLRLLVIY